MPDWTFARLSTELLEILRERYPDGLTTSPTTGKITTIPDDDSEIKVMYGLPRNVEDLTLGWKELKTKERDTLGSKGLKDLAAVAFALVDADEIDGARVEFEVELPIIYEDEL